MILDPDKSNTDSTKLVLLEIINLKSVKVFLLDTKYFRYELILFEFEDKLLDSSVQELQVSVSGWEF